MEKKSILRQAGALVLSISLLYLTVFYAGRAWKNSQK